MVTLLHNVRLSFPEIWTATKFSELDSDDKKKYSATALMDPSLPVSKKLEETIQAVAKDKWPTVKGNGFKNPLKDGDEKDWDGFADRLYIKASSKTRPTCVNRDRSPILEEDGILVGGCFVNMSVDIYAFDGPGGKLVCCSLRGIQYVSVGEPFTGARIMDPEEFELVEA